MTVDVHEGRLQCPTGEINTFTFAFIHMRILRSVLQVKERCVFVFFTMSITILVNFMNSQAVNSWGYETVMSF